MVLFELLTIVVTGIAFTGDHFTAIQALFILVIILFIVSFFNFIFPSTAIGASLSITHCIRIMKPIFPLHLGIYILFCVLGNAWGWGARVFMKTFLGSSNDVLALAESTARAVPSVGFYILTAALFRYEIMRTGKKS